MHYFVTVEKNGVSIHDRMQFDDYATAIEFLSEFYRPRFGRCVLPLTTEIVNGKFARSYGELNVPESIEVVDETSRRRYSAAAKLSNAFEYDASYFFLVESDVGIAEREQE